MSSPDLLSSQLMTPRTNIAEQVPSIQRAPLLESQALRTEIAAYNTTAKTYDDKVTTAFGISGIVRKSLNYKSFFKHTELLTATTLAQSEHTNCHGYVAVLSECLEQAGIEHYIGFANGHSFVPIGDEATAQYTLVDPVTRKYSGDITSALEGEDIFKQFKAGLPTATTYFHTDKMLKLRGLTSRTSELTEKNRWISHENPNNPWRREQPPHNYLLQMKVLPSTTGREALVHYANAMVEINRKNSDGATKELAALAGIYPDMDVRNDFELARNARSLALQQQKWGNALVIAEVIDKSAIAQDSPRGRYFKPDTLRKVGNLTGIAELLGAAIDSYTEIPGMNRMKAAKIMKTREQQQRADS